MAYDPYKALYLHIPFCVKRCGYCDFATSAVERDSPIIDEYVESLVMDIRRASREGKLGAIETVYLGGGTPSYIGMRRLSMLLYALSMSMHLEPEVECTMEANPESLTAPMVRDIWALGVNRLSLGVQSFDDEVLRILGRAHDAEAARAAVRAAQERFENVSVDLMCGIATPMAQAEYGVAKKSDIPVIFTAVTDPVAAELANADGTPVGEITGTSDKLPVEAQLKMIRQILPEAKNIGIMYTTSEVNSESAIAEYKELAPQYGFEIVDTGISSSADIALAADTLISKVDCITNLTDNTVVASLPVILDKAAAKNIPVFGSEIEQVKIGCLAAMGLDYIELGKQTGKMAAQVLRGEKKASEMNYETIKEAAFYGNTQVAGNLGITLPEDLTENAAELFTEIAQ